MTDPHEPPDDEIPLYFEHGEVPAEFHSVYLSGPFLHCIDCECDLLNPETFYSVIKSIVGKEPIFEMAICAECSMKLSESYSEESRAAIQQSISEWKRIRDQEHEREEIVESAGISTMNSCFGCGRPREECHRYSYVGIFFGRSMVTPLFSELSPPLMICDECNGQAGENLSQKTRDSWNRFVEEHFDGPPGIEIDSPSLEPILL